MKRRDFWQTFAEGRLFLLLMIVAGLAVIYLMITDLDWLPGVRGLVSWILLGLFVLGFGVMFVAGTVERVTGLYVAGQIKALGALIAFLSFLGLILTSLFLTPIVWFVLALAGLVLLVETFRQPRRLAVK